MIYPAFQKENVAEYIAFVVSEIIVCGYGKDFFEKRTENVCLDKCKGDKLYINIIKENTFRTEYIEEATKNC